MAAANSPKKPAAKKAAAKKATAKKTTSARSTAAKSAAARKPAAKKAAAKKAAARKPAGARGAAAKRAASATKTTTAAARKRAAAARQSTDAVVDRTAELSDDVLKSVERGQRAAIEAVRKFSETVDEALPARNRPSRREQVVDAALEMAEKLVSTQYDFLRSVVSSADRSLTGSKKKK